MKKINLLKNRNFQYAQVIKLLISYDPFIICHKLPRQLWPHACQKIYSILFPAFILKINRVNRKATGRHTYLLPHPLVHAYVHTYMNIHICMYRYICVYMYIRMYICMCILMKITKWCYMNKMNTCNWNCPSSSRH